MSQEALIQRGIDKEYPNFIKLSSLIVGKDAVKLKTDVYNEAFNKCDCYDILSPNCHFIDIDPKFCKRMLKRYPDANLKIGDIREIPHEDNKFDFVFDLSTIDHIEEYPKAIEEYHRVLRPGGLLLLVSYIGGIPPRKTRRGYQYYHDGNKLFETLKQYFDDVAHYRFANSRGDVSLVWFFMLNK